ncbi:hypothetical protein QE152_g30882 [Popillia japonica]|uniref:Uncharacterized protein n=1 Tax=Popillia japonica TaxID=7064 RepID=A0AAW1JD94_POPJA
MTQITRPNSPPAMEQEDVFLDIWITPSDIGTQGRTYECRGPTGQSREDIEHDKRTQWCNRAKRSNAQPPRLSQRDIWQEREIQGHSTETRGPSRIKQGNTEPPSVSQGDTEQGRGTQKPNTAKGGSKGCRQVIERSVTGQNEVTLSLPGCHRGIYGKRWRYRGIAQ